MNRLSNEKSPYLLQHAGNPVKWYQWCDDAFEKAVREDKPVFLSIGYSTCHWCHVMERESFEDRKVAEVLNKGFVTVKVDREERPDIDSVYMAVCQMMTGGGGWPLTIIMTPDKKPFFAGTYIPKETRYGIRGIIELLNQVLSIWQNRRDELLGSAEKITSLLQNSAEKKTSLEPGTGEIDEAYKNLNNMFDSENGGFGNKPKFPSPHNLMFLLRYRLRNREDHALEMVEKTLFEMQRGGIWDHVGYGFHRYSTDSYWLVPHFEKMLYDQSMLMMAYTEAYQTTGKEEYARTVRKIAEYIQRDMTSPDGAFYSAEDADSEGEEGRFYLWSMEEIRNALGKDAEIFAKVFNLESAGNFIDPATGEKDGRNILHIKLTGEELTEKTRFSGDELEKQIHTDLRTLLDIRLKRIRPSLDDKVLTDWNGLTIAALAKASMALDDKRYSDTARRSADFVLTTLKTPEGRLLHRYRDGEAAIAGTLDDYAFLLWGLIELYQATFITKYLSEALEISKMMIEHFYDRDNGGFYQTPDDGEELIFRHKPVYDGALPSGNSVAVYCLLRLSRITGDRNLENIAHESVKGIFSISGDSFPFSTHFISALDYAVRPYKNVVISGDRRKQDTLEMISGLRRSIMPNVTIVLNDNISTELSQLIPDVGNYQSIDGKATAYVCGERGCSAPVTTVDEMIAILQGDT